MNIRMATTTDVDQLVRMRWDFTLEQYPNVQADYEEYYAECSAFLKNGINGGKWFIWVADINGTIVSHIYIELIDKVPRPGRVTQPFAYMTNVYTDPVYRSQGIGSQILKAIRDWAITCKFEFIIVWPSEESREFYSRNSYTLCNDPMELHL